MPPYDIVEKTVMWVGFFCSGEYYPEVQSVKNNN